jgi:DNA-binding NarL/FixJ family response regulator
LWASRAILHSLIRGMLEIESPHRNFPMRALSPREIEVARYVAAGLPNKRIALRMDVTERTVKAHLSSIFQKTDASDRLELALLMRGELPERIRINLQ